MADLSLQSPTTFRLVAAATATVASLALVALGVQLGTDGLGAIGSDRNPASASASPAAAVVDLARPRPATVNLADTLLSLLPAAPATFASSGATTVTFGAGPSVAPAPAPAPSSPEPQPAPAPAPAPEPSPVPVPAPLPPAPALPAPLPIPLGPLAPVVGSLTEGADTLAAATTEPVPPPDEVAATEPVELLPTLTDLLGL